MRLHAIEHAAHLVRRLAVDVVEDELGVAEDGIERRAQLMAHIGEELRLVLARLRELPALVLDLMEQARVLDCQHRLGGKGLQQVDGLLWELARSLAADHESADDALGAEQRNNQNGAVAGPHDHLEIMRWRLLLQVRDLQRRTLARRLADTSISDADVPLLECRDQLIVHSVGGAQPEFLFGLVVIIDGARIGLGQLHGLADDGGQHLLEIERRVDRLADLAERAQLRHRLRQLMRARLRPFSPGRHRIPAAFPPCR